MDVDADVGVQVSQPGADLDEAVEGIIFWKRKVHV